MCRYSLNAVILLSRDEHDSEQVREWEHKLNEENLQDFKAYQEGTENLIP